MVRNGRSLELERSLYISRPSIFGRPVFFRQQGRLAIVPETLSRSLISGYFLLKLLPRNQIVHPFQNNLVEGIAFLGLTPCFGASDLIYGDYGPFAVNKAK